MHRDRVREKKDDMYTDRHTQDTNQHNRPGDGIMQCYSGWFSNEIWSCLSAIYNSSFPTTKTQSG